VLCDGAMGTMLYSCGVFINRCYDELNVTQAGHRASVHQQYLQAGAEIIETNTFGANSFRLENALACAIRWQANSTWPGRDCRQCVEAIREKQGTPGVCGGRHGTPGLAARALGKTSLEEARAAFAEQIEALAEGGVDLLMLETMMSVDEAEQAVLAAREVAPQLKVVVLFTVDEESNCLDGTSPEVAAKRMVAIGADAVGCNCSTGPAAVLSVIERMRADEAADRRDAQCGHAAQRRRTQYLSDLARIYGQLCAQVCARGSQLGGRLLRHHARAHPRDAQCPARHGGAGRGETAVAKETGRRNRDHRRIALSRLRCGIVRTSANALPRASS
jgi:methionine synthase I (cobalamin-dependent)